MGPASIDPDSSTNGTVAAGRELPEARASDPEDKVRAVADLLQNNILAHTFGIQGEWEVRTTLVANREAWRYRSAALLHGKEVTKGFPPIDGDWTGRIRKAEAVTEEMLATFAGEAVEAHFTFCAIIADYSLMVPHCSEPLPRYHRKTKVALALVGVAALLTVSWFWGSLNGISPEQSPRGAPPHNVQWQPAQVTYRHPAGEPFVFPLPTLARTSEGMPVEVTLEASGDRPSWLYLDRERLHIGGTAPLTAEDRTYRLMIRAHAAQGGDSQLLVLLTITGPPERTTPPPRLPGHWTW
jgi:hypothetical protein